jgi:ribosomal protein S18 acetylase RimI-like enzyme
VGADILGQPVGLSLATGFPGSLSAQLRSVVVSTHMRRVGIGTTLLAQLERELSVVGISELCARVTDDEPSTAVSRLLDRRQFETDDRSCVLYAARPLRLLAAPGLAATCADVEIVPFAPDLIERVRSLDDAVGFSPTSLPVDEYYPEWSFLAHRRETVVGWILGHPVERGARVSALYTVPGQRSLNLAASLIRTFVRHIAHEAVDRVTWEVRLDGLAWVRLMDHLLGRYSDERVVIRSRRKRLDGALAGVSAARRERVEPALLE